MAEAHHQRELTPAPAGERRKSLRISTADGVFATVHGNLTGGVIFTSFMISLGAQKFHFALLNAVSALAQGVQVFSAFLVGILGRRKTVVIASALASRLILCFTAFLPYLLPMPAALRVVICAAFLWGALGSISGNAWTGWMSDLVPRRIRGRYFSTRNFVLLIATTISSLAASWFLDQFSGEPPRGLLSLVPSVRGQWVFTAANKMRAFVFLYATAAVPAIACALLVHRQFEPVPLRNRERTRAFLPALREPFANRTFTRFLIFSSTYSFFNSFASPYWTPYCLEELRMSYFTLSLFGMVGTACALATTRFWGKLCDAYGNRPVILMSMFFVSFHPLLYLVATPDMLIPIYFDFASSGMMWTGFGIAMYNFLLLTGKGSSKEMSYAIYAATGAVVVFLGSLASGCLIGFIPTLRVGSIAWNNIQVTFLCTSILRFLSLIVLKNLMSEPGARSPGAMLRRILHLARPAACGTPRVP